MIRLINLDPNSDNYILDNNGERIRHLDSENLSRIVYTNGKGNTEITFAEDLRKQFCGMYYTERMYEDDNAVYYFDDGYYNKMITSGYIVLNNYDGMKAPKELGEEISKKLFFKIHEAFEMLSNDSCTVERLNDKDPMLIIKINTWPYEYTIRCRSTTSLSEANQLRKINNLPYYPFDARMDKYGTYYIACYAKLNDEAVLDEMTYIPPDKYTMNLLSEFIQRINYDSKSDVYHFEPVKAKKPVIYTERNEI